MGKYTVFDDGRTLRGNAREVLEQIRRENAKDNGELAAMDTDHYAQAVVEDAPYFLPDGLLRALEQETFDSVYDRALAYLSQMPTSGIRILTARQEA